MSSRSSNLTSRSSSFSKGPSSVDFFESSFCCSKSQLNLGFSSHQSSFSCGFSFSELHSEFFEVISLSNDTQSGDFSLGTQFAVSLAFSPELNFSVASASRMYGFFPNFSCCWGTIYIVVEMMDNSNGDCDCFNSSIVMNSMTGKHAVQ